MSAAAFDARRFAARLVTQAFGRHLVVRAESASTNDEAWDALAAGAPHGTVLVAEAQTRGRGRAGRAWHTAPGRGLAMSLLLRGADGAAPGRDAALPDDGAARLAALPLVAGLALAEGLERLGARPALKWPNDVLLDGRKVAGLLCERRGRGAGPEALVIGAGVNVEQSRAELPEDLRDTATSLAIAGVGATREDVAAEFLNAFERRWAAHLAGAGDALAAWSARAAFGGAAVRVRTPGGELRGVARGIDADGALLLEREGGGIVRVLAGDLEAAPR